MLINDIPNWKKAKLSGDIGEADTMPLLIMPVWCWKTNSGLCHYWQDVEYLAKGGKVDADVLISFDNCKECLLHGAVSKVTQQFHEIKTNIATFDKAMSGDSNRTQNLFIELVQWTEGYLKHNVKWEYDRLEGKELPYIEGIGWWKKREYAFERGLTKYDKADWYHFNLPLDMWERFQAVKEKRGNKVYKPYETLERPIGGEAQYLTATDEEIEEWLDDWFIDEGAILITQMPVGLCISVPVEVVKRWVREREEKWDELTSEWGKQKTNDMWWVDNDVLRAYKVPVRQAIPCINWGTFPPDVKVEDIYTNGEDGVLVSLVGEYVVKGKDRGRRYGVIPYMTRANSIRLESTGDYYVPARIAGADVYDKEGNKIEGVTGINVNAFRNPDDKTGAVWVPRIIVEFSRMKLKKYPYEY